MKYLRMFCLLGWLAVSCAFAGQQLHAQSIDWQDLGPSNSGGRVRALHVSPDGTVWAGGVGGGLWKSTNEGISWSPVPGFNIATSATSNVNLAVTSVFASGNLVVVGTGEVIFSYNIRNSGTVAENISTLNSDGRGFLNYAGTPGNGVFISTDGGASFDNTNLTRTSVFPLVNYRVADNPFMSIQKVVARNGRVFVAAADGLYYSDDNFVADMRKATDNFTDPRDPNDPSFLVRIADQAVLDIELGPNNIVVATTRLATFISNDNGVTFGQRFHQKDLPRDYAAFNNDTSRIAPLRPGRVEVAVAPSDPNYMYIAEVNATGILLGVWRSTDAGNTWALIGPASTGISVPASSTFAPTEDVFTRLSRGIYSLMLGVSPAQPERVFLGSQEWFEYTPQDGWNQNDVFRFQLYPADPKFVPADLHAFAAHPTKPNLLFLGSNSGVTRSVDGGEFFAMVNNGLNITNTYAAAPGIDGDIMISTSAGLKFREATSTTNFIQRSSAFGPGDVQASQFFPTQFIASGRNGDVRRSLDNGLTFENFLNFPIPAFRSCISALFPISPDTQNVALQVPGLGDPTSQGGPELTPFVLDERLLAPDGKVADTAGTELNPRYVFTANTGGVWLVTRPFAILNQDGDPIQEWTRISPKFDNLGSPTAITVSGDTNHVVYVGTSTGRVFRITSATNPCSPNYRWDEITPTEDFFADLYISDIAVDPFNPNVIAITQGAYVPSDFVGASFSATGKVAVSQNASDTANPVIWFNQYEFSGVLPDIPVYTALFNPDTNRAPDDWYLMVGTEYGIYTTNAITQTSSGLEPVNWVEQNGGQMKRTPVYDLKVQNYESYRVTPSGSQKSELYVRPLAYKKVFAATHGRGIFSFEVAVGSGERAWASGLAANRLISVYPNPANQTANLRLLAPVASEVAVQVRNATGQAVLTLPVETVPPNGTIRFGTTQLPNGLYFVEANVNGLVQTCKLVVQH